NTILVTFFTGVLMGLVLLYVKFENPEAAFTHTLNELRYYINCGIVVLICTAGFFLFPNHRAALIAFVATIPLHLIFQYFFPDMNYFVRAGWVIVVAFTVVAIPSAARGFTPLKQLFQYDSPRIGQIGLGLLASLILLHIIFH
ncbi:MAG: hypothetical protein AAFY48_04150, partial [Bacteroidota bacterium]